MLPVLLVHAASAPVTTPLAIMHVNVVRPGSESIAKDVTVVTDGDKITFVGAGARVKLPSGTTVVDGTGKYLIPGLWDMHVHLMDTRQLSLFTANGVTGVRSMFGSPMQLQWRKQAEAGDFVSPRLIVGSPIVDGAKPIWQGSIAVADEVKARESVQKIKKDGYDFVKVYSLLTNKVYHAIAEEAKKQKIPFAGHVPHSVDVSEAAKAGQATSEHMMGIAVASSTKGAEVRTKFDAGAGDGMTKLVETSRAVGAEVAATFDRKLFDEMVDVAAKQRFWQCPTLVVLKSVAYLDQAKMTDPRLKYMSPFVTATWDPEKDFRFKGRSKEDWASAKTVYKGTVSALSAMIKKGVPVIAGTDCLNPFVFPGFSLPDEIALLADAGMTPTQALAAATLNPARFLKIEKVAGTVDIGKRADLVLLDGDPLSDLANLKRISAVVQRGKYFDRAALDALLARAAYPQTSGGVQGGLCPCLFGM